MRLLNTDTQKLEFFQERGRPRYAILSHTWDHDEVLFVDIVSQDRGWRKKASAEKVLGSCKLARKQGYQYIWIDTCCIDKNSSAELSEAINSMFNWYMEADVCYVYLTDVADNGSIAKCLWFKRGWTLQELIAPTSVYFYDTKWRFINDKISISSELASYTGIDESLLRCGHSLNPPLLKHHVLQATTSGRLPGRCSCGRRSSFSRLSQLRDYCVAQKMSWASSRETTRGEDMAYCLMGLFEINMPLLYGEGCSRAFFRLQKEIIENTHDQSILATTFFPRWELRKALASHPHQFTDSGVVHFRPILTGVAQGDKFSPMTMELTKFGVNVDLLVVPEIRTEVIFGVLDFQMGKNPLGRPAIPLHPMTRLDSDPVFCRRGEGLFEISPEHPHHARNLRVLTGRADVKTSPDRSIELEALKWRKIIILQNFDESDSNTYKKSLPARIHCVSNSSGCQPYSVESESQGRAILKKPGYPRLLIQTLKTDNITGYSSMIWILKDVRLSHGFMPDDTEDAEQLLAKIIDYQAVREFGRIGLIGTDGEFYHGSDTLVVRGHSDLKVEVKFTPVEFLNWTTPEVTVYTTEMESFKIEVLP